MLTMHNSWERKPFHSSGTAEEELNIERRQKKEHHHGQQQQQNSGRIMLGRQLMQSSNRSISAPPPSGGFGENFREDDDGSSLFPLSVRFRENSSMFPKSGESSSLRPPPGLGGLGARRPASTGVIGETPVANLPPISRPVPKTLMELIQEDFPKTPSPELLNMKVEEHTVTHEHMLRPRSASPPRSKTFFPPNDSNHGPSPPPPNYQPNSNYNHPYEQQHQQLLMGYTAPAPPQPHYVSIPVSQLHHHPSRPSNYPVVNAVPQQQFIYYNPVRVSPYYAVAPLSMAVPIHHAPPLNMQQPEYTTSPDVQKKLQKKTRKNKKKDVHATSLLEEFRNSSKTRSWSIEDIQGYIVNFCFDQNGSRFLQQRLEIASFQEKQIVMKEVLPDIKLLRNDVFGNYVIQKLFEYGTGDMKNTLFATLEDQVLQMSLQMYGCRVVQKAFESLSEKQLLQLLQEFHGNVITCIHDQNGNHVIQKIIEIMCTQYKVNPTSQMEHIEFIFKVVLDEVQSLSCHPYGCRVLQRMLEHSSQNQRIRALNTISTCHETLLDDQYGNYVIQHVLQFGRYQDRESILQIVVSNDLLSLSRQKFASNVVEKLLKYGTPDQRKRLVREMLKPHSNHPKNVSVVLLMVRDAYANYVVQTTLDVVPDGSAERKLLLEELNSHSSLLKNFTFAKHIVAKLE